jgi:hypothetical protein
VSPRDDDLFKVTQTFENMGLGTSLTTYDILFTDELEFTMLVKDTEASEEFFKIFKMHLSGSSGSYSLIVDYDIKLSDFS